MRLHSCLGAVIVSLVLGLCGLVTGCGSSHPTSTATTAAITAAWTSFFNGATPAAEKAAELQGGPTATSDIHLFFALLPASLTTKVDSIRVNGTTATVTYEFFAGTSALSPRPMTGTAVFEDGKWLVSQASWSAWVRKSDIHGSG